MNLHSVQNGEANRKGENPDCPLTEKGEAGVRRMAPYLASNDESATAINYEMSGAVCLERDEGSDRSVWWMLIPKVVAE